jgi:hypothetical protein
MSGVLVRLGSGLITGGGPAGGEREGQGDEGVDAVHR